MNQAEQLAESSRCQKCGAWHGRWPLEHLSPEEDCRHNREQPCKFCGMPVGGLSMGGSEVCGFCDSGLNRNGSRWTIEQTALAYRHARALSAYGIKDGEK